MSRVVLIQTNFVVGEIDPLLRGRIDLNQYYNGLQKATNVVIQPQGGARRREGLQYISALDAVLAAQAVRLVPFQFNVNDSYMFAIVPGRVYIFKNKALVTNINGSGNNYLAVAAFTSAIIPALKFAQSADTIIFVQEDMQPVKFVRGASDSNWTVSNLSFDKIPQYAFQLQNFEPVATMTPSGTSGNITIDVSAYTSDTGNLQAATTSTVTLKAAASGTNDIFKGLCVKMTSGAQNGKARKISAYNGTTKVATIFPDWDTAPLAGDSYKVVPFADESVNQYINASPQGRAKIVEYVDDDTVKAITEIPFFDTTARTSGNWDLECLYENTWSTARGWPRSVTFHEGRLFFAGSKSRPTTVWGSRVNDFFNFEYAEGLDDEAVEATIDTSQLNTVTDIYSGRDLQIFSIGGEFYVPQALLDPITPSNFIVRTATKIGAKNNFPIIGLDSGTLFLQRQGKSINEMLFTDTEATYIANNVTLLSGHLVKNPVDMALKRATSTDDTDRLFVVNGDDGSIMNISLLRSQNVIAPSELTTDGQFKSVAVDVDTVYVVVKRSINGADAYYVEAFNRDLTLDCASFANTGAANATVAHLVAESVKIIRDGVLEPDQTVPAGGLVTFATAATSSWRIGLNYDIQIKTMPVEAKLPSGTIRGFKKRIIEINADLYQTQAMTINDNQVQFRQFGEDVLDKAITEYTGVKRAGPLLGFTDEGAITVTQPIPLKFNLLNLEYKVSIGQ